MKISLERKLLKINLAHAPFRMLPFGHQKAERDSYFGKKKSNKYDTVDTAESVCTLGEKNPLHLSAGNIAVQPALKKRKRAVIFLLKKYILKKRNENEGERERGSHLSSSPLMSALQRFAYKPTWVFVLQHIWQLSYKRIATGLASPRGARSIRRHWRKGIFQPPTSYLEHTSCLISLCCQRRCVVMTADLPWNSCKGKSTKDRSSDSRRNLSALVSGGCCRLSG